MTATIKLLSTEQTKAFDTEYVDAKMFTLVQQALESYSIINKPFTLMDVGGGNGKYADKFLSCYPNAHVTVLDSEYSLLEKNTSNQRKNLIHAPFQNVSDIPKMQVIQFNWVLHHFVSSGYKESCALQLSGLKDAYELLEPGGVILIFENFYDGWPMKELPSNIIHQLTASTSLAAITSKMGANTAGVGVCFHSEQYWRDLLNTAGFNHIKSKHCYDFGNLSTLKKICLCINEQRVGLLIAQKPI
ncbi:methyltransferase [Aliivibrio logei]|uniref:methyltransferase n=1 Tax=Aliivibrio logei TaxID=688 RepID=UPI0003A259EF|nr:methyltransferase [Aliivibrio logei]